MSTTIYYTATSLDGFIADDRDDLTWLFVQDQDPTGVLNSDEFAASVGAIVMGSTTYLWLLAELERTTQPWPYTNVPVWVLTTRDLQTPPDADVRFAQGPVTQVHEALRRAAGERTIWVIGGGDVAGQFCDADLLDEVVTFIAPVTLGRGRPLLPRRRQLHLLELARNKDFIVARFSARDSVPRW